MLAILDYDAGNQTSVSRALHSLGIANAVASEEQTLEQAEGVIFPGVGAAGQAMGLLRERGLDGCLRRLVAARIPLLGVCLGCQIMLDYSEENNTQTLGLARGTTRRFDPAWADEDGEPIRIPHMGWNSVRYTAPCRLFDGIEENAEFYFVHSYYPEPEPELILGQTRHGRDFCSVFGRDGLWAVQFHAEKSGRAGLRLLRNFYTYCQERGAC